MERNNSSTCSQQPDVAAGALRRLEVLYVGGQRGERVRVGRGASCPGRPARVCAWCPDISSRCTRHHLAAHAVCPGSMCWVGNHTCAGATTHASSKPWLARPESIATAACQAVAHTVHAHALLLVYGGPGAIGALNAPYPDGAVLRSRRV